MTSLDVLQNTAFRDEDEVGPDLSPKQPKTKSGAFTFRLRVALRSSRSTHQPMDEEDEEEDGGKDKRKSSVNGTEHIGHAKGARRVQFKGEPAETPVMPPSPPEDRGTDSPEDVPDSFLTRREQNIKANKAMVNR